MATTQPAATRNPSAEDLPALHFIEASDAVRIAARRFQPALQPKAALVIAPAMGVSQGFYAAFARWLTTQGYAAYTFDYRGTGASRPEGSLRGYRANISDWAQLDCAAVIEHVSAEQPGLPIFWVGHSVGAQILGLIPNHRRLTAMLSVAAGSGYHRLNAPPLRYYAPVLWHALAPLALRLAGYFPGRRLGLVGDLPYGVMVQWRKWCLSPAYLGGESPEVRARLAHVKLPISAWSMRDDEMMTFAGTRALFALYTGAPVELVRMDPAAHGLRSIGHFGFFRAQSRDALWPLVTAWVERHAQALAAERCA